MDEEQVLPETGRGTAEGGGGARAALPRLLGLTQRRKERKEVAQQTVAWKPVRASASPDPADLAA